MSWAGSKATPNCWEIILQGRVSAYLLSKGADMFVPNYLFEGCLHSKRP